MNEVKIKIGIFDDHPIITDGVKNLLQHNEEIELILIAHTKDELLSKLSATVLDVLILDVVTDDVTGLELFKDIPLKYPSLSIIAYTTLSSVVLIENILRTGAKGYFNKKQPVGELIEAIKTVYSGESYIMDQFSFLLETKKQSQAQIELSNRELEVMMLILEGKITKEIADILSISKNTVENHRTNIFKKFRVSNLAELIRQANRLGYTFD